MCEKKINSLMSRAQLKCAHIERFSGYFKFKSTLTLNLFEKINLGKESTVLEIGCGTGFQSALLATKCKNVIATDLPDFTTESHTIGIKNVKEMVTGLNMHNIQALGCTAEYLPFKDKSFNSVFLFTVLEHVHNKNRALDEMKRVLKDGGTIVCSVPTYIASTFEFPALYLYIVKRVVDVVKSKLFKTKVNHQSIFFKNEITNNKNVKGLIKTFLHNYPGFPLPKPHGDWVNKKGRQSIFTEFYNQLPWKWPEMFSKSGLKVDNSFAALFIPYSIIEIFSPQCLTKLFCGTQFLHQKLASSFFKHFSIVICYIIKK